MALLAVVLLGAFLIASWHLARESFWADEAWTAWAIHSPFIRDTLERVRNDVHPPLYFLLIDGWAFLTGESVYSLRLFSTLFGMVGLAATYAVGKRLFDRPTALIAVLLLGTASFFVYYTREARMYTLLLALGALVTLFYLRWHTRPNWRSTLLYSLFMAALLYTHYAGALVILSQLLHLLLTTLIPVLRQSKKPPCLYWLPLPYLLTGLLFLPWLPTFLNQMRANPNGPLAIPLPTDANTINWLVSLVTSSSGALLVLPFLIGKAVPLAKRYASALLLLLIWLLLTPIGLLALNAWVAPVYQVRYVIALLPAGALLAAYGFRHIALPSRLGLTAFWSKRLQSGLAAAFVLVFGVTQLSAYGYFWWDKPAWEPTIRNVTTTRQPLEPTITDFVPYSPAAYYDSFLHLRQGISLDLSWRLHSAEEARALADLFQNEPSVWVALPVNTAKTWHITAELDRTRHVGYRSSLVNMIFYRFDAGDTDDLRFRFGDLLRFENGPTADQQLSVHAGQPLCVDLSLTALQALDNQYSAGLHLVDLPGTANLAAWDGGIGSANAGETRELSPCLDIPASTPPGHYHLELVVYNWATVQRLPVIEDGAGEGLGWQDLIGLAGVEVTGG